MAPIYLKPLLELYASPAAENCPHAAKYTNTVLELVACGFVEEDDSDHRDDYEPIGYRLTGKGKAFVDALCSIPDPVKIWHVPIQEASRRKGNVV